MTRQQVEVHPDYSGLNRWHMNLGLNRVVLPVLRLALVFLERKCPPIEGVSFEDYREGDVDLRIYTPDDIKHSAALVWIHGGGMVAGSARNPMDHSRCGELALELGIRVFSLNYRLAPEYPFPAPLDDCYEAWRWLLGKADHYGIDTSRIAIGGESAGGNYTAGLVQRLRDEGGVQPAAQYLVYPTLDDRTGLSSVYLKKKYLVLNAKDVHFAWKSYLGEHFGSLNPAPYAVPGRCDNLSGLPPTWIGAGTADVLFEDSEQYAKRLEQAGVKVSFERVEGGPHGLDCLVPTSAISQSFRRHQYDFLREHLRLG